MMDYRSARYTEGGKIDCEVNHPDYGWIPFTAAPDDVQAHCRELHARIVAAGDAAPYVAPPAPTAAELLAEWRLTAFCTPLQGQLALGETRWQQVELILADPATSWEMRQSVRSASVWNRRSDMIAALGAALGLTPEEVDDLFRLAVTLNQ